MRWFLTLRVSCERSLRIQDLTPGPFPKGKGCSDFAAPRSDSAPFF